MAIDLSEKTVSLTDACQLLPARRGGKKPHVSTLYRWAEHGLNGIRLETLQVGGTICTSTEALERFFAALDSAKRRQTPPTLAMSLSPQRRREIERAKRELSEAGFLPSANGNRRRTG